jgi:hypothetical protein
VANIEVVTFSATRRSGLADAEAVIGGWLAGNAEIPGDVLRAGAGTKEKAPRSRGVTRGPKRLA